MCFRHGSSSCRLFSTVERPVTERSETNGEVSAVARRRLDLLRQISDAGGTLSPLAEPNGKYGYRYPVAGDNVEDDLGSLLERNYLEARFCDRVSLCPRCGSHHLNVREVCPSCRSAYLTSEGLFHHFRCGYVGIPSEFIRLGDRGYRCPKCNGTMRHLGTEYDRLGRAFVCRGCGVISENPPVEAVCLSCRTRVAADKMVSTVVFGYVLSSRGAAAVRAGSFFNEAEELPTLEGAPIYKRPIILQFLEQEVKRRERLNSKFAVLLARFIQDGTDQGAAPSATEWLGRLRDCLRDVDLVGQLTAALYIVILPDAGPRDAESMRRGIAAKLGPQSPLDLSTPDIANQRDLAELLLLA